MTDNAITVSGHIERTITMVTGWGAVGERIRQHAVVPVINRKAQ